MRHAVTLVAFLLLASVATAADSPTVLGADGGPDAHGYYPVRVRKLERVEWEFRAGVKMGMAVPAPDGSLRVMAGGGNLHRLDPATGRSLWAAGGNTRYWNYSGPALAPDGTAYGGNYDWISAIGPDGAVRWRTPLKASWIHRPPVLSPDARTLYVGADNVGLASLDAATGEVNWLRRDFRSPGTRYTFDPAGRLVAAFRDRVACFEADGKVAWEIPGGVSSLMTVGRLLVMSRKNTLLALDADTRETRFSVDVGGEIRGIALSDEDRIVASLVTGELAQVDLAGRLRWRHRISPGKISSPVTALGGETVVMDAAGVVYLLDSNGFPVSSIGTGASFNQWRPSVGPDGRVYVSGDDRLLCIGGAERDPPRRLVATGLVAVADDFVVDAWVDGTLVPLDHRHLLAEVFGATTERIAVDLREGDFVAFHVVANRLRWSGVSYFAVAALDDDEGIAFVSRPGEGWYSCDDPAAAAEFVARRDAGLDRPAGSPAKEWSDGPGQFRGRIPGEFTGAPVWGEGGSTWLKVLVPDRGSAAAGWKLLATGDLAAAEIERTLYYRPEGGGFYAHFRVVNRSTGPIEVCLGNRSRVFYPNQWGALEAPERGIIDEERIDPTVVPAPAPGASRVSVAPAGAADYYVAFEPGRREEVTAAGGRFVFLSFDGVIDLLAGDRWERLTLPWTDGERELEESMAASTLILPRPIAWKPLPPDGRVVP